MTLGHGYNIFTDKPTRAIVDLPLKAGDNVLINKDPSNSTTHRFVTQFNEIKEIEDVAAHFKTNVNASLVKWNSGVQAEAGLNSAYLDSSSSQEYSLLIEIKTHTANIKDLTKVELTGQFRNDVDKHLPCVFDREDDENVQKYQDFFESWGSHVIDQESLGGVCDIRWKMKTSSTSQSDVRSMASKIQTDFLSGVLSGGAEAASSKKNTKQSKASSSKGIQKTYFYGGRSCFHKAETINEWIGSLEETHVPLKSPLQKTLQPLYKLLEYNNSVESTKLDALREATTLYLKPGLRWGVISHGVDEVGDFSYDGEIVCGTRQGYGVCDWTNGSGTNPALKYEGEWESNIRCGKGKCYYKNGNRYEGSWKDDKKCGIGTYFYHSSARWEGSWGGDKGDQRHGTGVHYYTNGDWDKSQYHNGDQIPQTLETHRAKTGFFKNLFLQ